MLSSSLSLYNNQNNKRKQSRILRSPPRIRLQGGIKFWDISFSFPAPRPALGSLCSYHQTSPLCAACLLCPKLKVHQSAQWIFSYHCSPLPWVHTHIWHSQTHSLPLPSSSALLCLSSIPWNPGWAVSQHLQSLCPGWRHNMVLGAREMHWAPQDLKARGWLV